eukprot:9522043-Heterocapsa_arctica.AAC.1
MHEPRSGQETARGAAANRNELHAAVLFGFYFMCRALEYHRGFEAGKILRSVDVNLHDEGEKRPCRADVQFRVVKRRGRWSSNAIHGYLHENAEE